MMSLRLRYIIVSTFALALVFLSTHFYRSGLNFHLSSNPPLKYKPQPTAPAIPIVDNFPFALAAHSAADLPPLPSWNTPPNPHVAEITPLFIGFTRNWRLLQQVVVSYITSGWPASDIYVVENTGVMDSNTLGLLSLQNPFFLNHTRLSMLGVNILVTPTLLTFAQLQNFYLATATNEAWPHYFWSHMDVVSISLESDARFPPSTTITPPATEPWESATLYANCVRELRNVTSGSSVPWANVFFSYDRLALVNVAAYKSVGGWDTLIPFYMTDCDMHSRLTMGLCEIFERRAGLVYDVASSLEDLVVLYRQKGRVGKDGGVEEVGVAGWVDPNARKREEEEAEKETYERVKRADSGEREKRKEEDKDHSVWTLFSPHPPFSSSSSNPKPDPKLWSPDTPASSTYTLLTDTLDHMQNSKGGSKGGRNTWQARQSGGQGDPFYRDGAGFEKGIQMTIEHGRRVYSEKWGHRDCDIYAMGLRAGDAWRVEHDWD